MAFTWRYMFKPISDTRIVVWSIGRWINLSIGSPSSNVSTSTDGLTSGYNGIGKSTLECHLKFRINRCKFRASNVRSSCSCMGPLNCRILSSSLNSLIPGSWLAKQQARIISSKSFSIKPETPGCRILTATSELDKAPGIPSLILFYIRNDQSIAGPPRHLLGGASAGKGSGEDTSVQHTSPCESEQCSRMLLDSHQIHWRSPPISDQTRTQPQILSL